MITPGFGFVAERPGGKVVPAKGVATASISTVISLFGLTAAFWDAVSCLSAPRDKILNLTSKPR
jgi:hypothetical protein